MVLSEFPQKLIRRVSSCYSLSSYIHQTSLSNIVVSERLTRNLQEDQKYPSSRNETHRVRIGRCVWQISSQKILEVSCGTRDECDP